MRVRHPSLLVLPLLATALAISQPSTAAVTVQISGATQGNIVGSSVVPGHANWIDLYSFQHGVEVGIGANGLPGQVSLSDVTVTKLFDRSSIKLLTAIANGELLTNCTIEFTASSSPTPYYRVSLGSARIDGYSQSSGGDNPSESISLSYSTITLTDVALGTSVTYTRYPTGTAYVAPGQWDKGFLLPAAPNPTQGETQFRFSIPASSNAELAVFDAQGRKIRTLHNGWTAAAPEVAEWNGTDDRGAKVPPGMYLARLAYPGTTVTQRFTVVR